MILKPEHSLPDHLAGKIASDPYYRDAFAHFRSLGALEKAGFFDDGLTPDEVATLANPRWAVTPLNKITRRQTQQKPVVLATTGALAPVHGGHLEMMEEARNILTQNGFEVLGGFFCPAHDSYVSTKSKTAARWNADPRLAALYETIAESDWLSVDPWMCRYMPLDLNFTDVILRLKSYIRHHRKDLQDVEIAYVFGSDNAYFMRTFVTSGYAVCVNRPGFEADLDLAASEVMPAAQDRLFFVRHTQNTCASRVLRLQPLPSESHDTPSPYLIRNDLDWATRDWPLENKGNAIAGFLDGLEEAICAAFDAPIEVIRLSGEDQQKIADGLALQGPVLNIDAVTSTHNIDIGFSRLFDLSNGQNKHNGVLPRESLDKLKTYLETLEAGEYTLVDDDIVSGSSMNGLENILPAHIKVSRRVSLAEELFKQTFLLRPFKIWDIVDARDFLLGAKLGGLFIRLLDGQLGRAPYIAPYVNLASRAKLPIGTEMSFSRRVIELNVAFHQQTKSQLTLAQTDPAFALLMKQSGFAPTDKLCDICRAHLSLLTRNTL